MARSEAKIRADKKYRKKLKRFVVELHEDEMEEVNRIKKEYSLTGKQLIRIGIDQIKHEQRIIPHARKLYAQCESFREVRKLSGLTQAKFSEIFHVPKRTIEGWDMEKTGITPYQLEMIKYILIHEGIINTKKAEED